MSATKRLILIGVPTYAEGCFGSLASVAKNIADLKAHFTSDWDVKDLSPRWSADSIKKGPKTKKNEGLEDYVKGVSDTLVVYFAGHAKLNTPAVPGGPSELVLCVRKSRYHDDRYKDGISIQELGLIVASSKAAKKLLILDCCHSGEAAFQFTKIRQHYSTEGTAILYSCAADEQSYAPQNAQNTFFTGLLLETLRSTVGEDSITAGQLSKAVRKKADSLRSGDSKIPENGSVRTDESIELPAKPLNFDKIVRWSLDVTRQDLPNRVRGNHEVHDVVGFVCAKLWSVELRRLIASVIEELRYINDRLVHPKPEDTIETYYNLTDRTVAAERTLRVRQESFDFWPEYLDIVERVHKTVDTILGQIRALRRLKVAPSADEEGLSAEQYAKAREKYAVKWGAQLSLLEADPQEDSLELLKHAVEECLPRLRQHLSEANDFYEVFCRLLRDSSA
ncbi:MAG: caspase family protein [Rhodopirellula sp.]|nr:caspase family protein [Rhodopirellula sp.]